MAAPHIVSGRVAGNRVEICGEIRAHTEIFGKDRTHSLGGYRIDLLIRVHPRLGRHRGTVTAPAAIPVSGQNAASCAGIRDPARDTGRVALGSLRRRVSRALCVTAPERNGAGEHFNIVAATAGCTVVDQ